MLLHTPRPFPCFNIACARRRHAALFAALLTLGGALCALARPAHADSWALLIGIDQYEDSDNIARLGGADNDANALAKALIESGGFPAAHVHVLTSGATGALKPSRHNILHELEALRQRVRPGDTVFIAYSGHGVESENVPYLLPCDADITTPQLIRDSGIPEEKFRDYLKSVPAKAMILVFDMCRVNADKSGRAGAQEDAHLSGDQVRGLDFSQIVKGGGKTATADPSGAVADRPQIVAEFFACAPNTRSYEWKDKERGYFSYYLEQGLRGAAKAAPSGHTSGVSLDSLKRYLATAVPNAVRENELGKTQTPTGDIVGPLDAGDFLIATSSSSLVPVITPAVVPAGGNAASRPVLPLHVLLTTLRGHTGCVWTASFSPDGRYILTASKDHTAKIWDAATGQEIQTIQEIQTVKEHPDAVCTASFSPDGRYIVTRGGENTANVWDRTTGQEIRTLRGHTDTVNSASFSPDGRYVVTGSSDNTAKVWDVATGQEIRTFSGHRELIFQASFSPDGRYILTGSADCTAKIWDVATGQAIRTLRGHTQGAPVASFSPDGLYVVTGSWDCTAKIWDVATGQEIRTLSGHKGAVLAVSFSPDGHYIVTASFDHTAKIWDAVTGQEIQTLNGHTDDVTAASFSPDGRYIVTGSMDNTAKVWEVATGKTGE